MVLIVSCAALTVVAGIYVLVPLFKGTENRLDVELMAETEMDRLLDRKASIYRNLKDLTLEYKMGRLSDLDFRQLEADYKKDAAAILQELENLEGSLVTPADTTDASPGSTAVRDTDSPNTKNNKTPVGAIACPSCGAESLPGKKFCGDCGHTLINSRQSVERRPGK